MSDSDTELDESAKEYYISQPEDQSGSDWDSQTDSDDNIYSEPERTIVPVNFVTRKEWGAEAGSDETTFTYPAEDVIYSYTETNVCNTRDECIESMRQMQKDHKAEGLPDIRYNFVIGGDGIVYEGRGWKLGAPPNEHYPTFQGNHIEFAHSGRRGDFPTKAKVDLINSLFDYGVDNNYLSEECRTFIDYLWPTN